MSCVNAFAVGPSEESTDWKDIAKAALTLNKADFVDGGYPVDERRFERVRGKQTTASSSKRKRNPSLDSGLGRDANQPIPLSDAETSDTKPSNDAMITLTPLDPPITGP